MMGMHSTFHQPTVSPVYSFLSRGREKETPPPPLFLNIILTLTSQIKNDLVAGSHWINCAIFT
jgi:hypothetical protein